LKKFGKLWEMSESNQNTAKLLVVDDEKSILDYVGLGLKYEGFSYSTAASCAEARKKLAEEEVNLVVLDRMLPDGDGLHLCQWIKETRGIPVLMLSALGEVEDRVEGLNVGADDYLPKPFQFVELVARVRALLRRPKVGAVSDDSEGDIVSGDLRISRTRRRVFPGACSLRTSWWTISGEPILTVSPIPWKCT
jgi:DNA-binding response OmpR family regulator